MKAGMVFQMADDILDYMAEEGELGKTICKDLEEGKITLPLLHLLREAEEGEASEIKEIIKDSLSEESLTRIMVLLKKYRSIEASFDVAKSLIDEAKAKLSVFPDTPHREALLAVADYSLYRGK
jgi:octaprenyl-diphosphate synthase